MDSYDVIIVGTGAGGGTLARHLAPSGKRILLLERGDWLPREPSELARAGRLRRQPLRAPRTPGTTTQGKPFQPQIHYFVGGATKLYGAALYRLAGGGLRRARVTTTGSRRPGRSPTTSSSPTTRRPSSCTRCTARTARTRPSRTPARRTHFLPSRTSRGSSSSRTISTAAGYHPFHAPCGIRLNEQNMPYSACVRCQNCDGFPCAVHGKSDADVLGRAAGARASERRRCSRTRRPSKLETNDAGTAVTEDRRRAERRSRDATPATSSFVACGAANTAKLLLVSATDEHPNGPRQRLRPGRSQLHVPQQRRGARAVARTRTRPSSRRRSD